MMVDRLAVLSSLVRAPVLAAYTFATVEAIEDELGYCVRLVATLRR